MIDVLVINDAEARELSRIFTGEGGKKSSFEVSDHKEHGALLFHESNVFFAPALPLEEVFDPTGAGDAFAGGFIGYLAKTNDISYDNMKRAVIYGSAMASFCVEKFGTERLTELAEEDIEERVNDFVDLVQFDIALVD
jgi:sugar/nucleoside kinase (ribokinase family)